MKKTFIKLFLLSAAFTTSCASLKKQIDNFFKEYAIEEYNNDKYEIAPYTRSIKMSTNSELPFYQRSDGKSVSLISGQEFTAYDISSDTDSSGFAGFTYYWPYGTNNIIYDAFGNSCQVSSHYSAGDDDIIFLSTASDQYKSIFHISNDANIENRLAAIIVHPFGGKYFYKDSHDSVFNFSFATDSRIEGVTTIHKRDINGMYELNKYEYSVNYKNGPDMYFYINKEDSAQNVHVRSAEILNYNSNYTYLFNLIYSKINYTYAVEETGLTNDFDFFFSKDFATAYGIELSPGNYKIHTTHMKKVKYFPLAVIPSANHDYLMALCLKIGDNKMLEPNYYVTKFYGLDKVSKFSTEVELIQQTKFYFKFNKSYILMDSSSDQKYGKLDYLKQNFCYMTNESNQGPNQIHFEKTEYSASGSVMSVIPETNTIFVNESHSKTINKISVDKKNISEERNEYDEIIDSRYVLYRKGTKLYFQNELVSEVAINDSIALHKSFAYSLLGKRYTALIYKNTSKSEYIYIGCKG